MSWIESEGRFLNLDFCIEAERVKSDPLGLRLIMLRGRPRTVHGTAAESAERYFRKRAEQERSEEAGAGGITGFQDFSAKKPPKRRRRNG